MIHFSPDQPPAVGLTPRQRELLDYLTVYVSENSYSPSYTEMMAAVGLKSKSNIHRLVTGLHDRGAVTRLPGRDRSVYPVRSAA